MAIIKDDFSVENKKIYIFRQKDILVRTDDNSKLPDSSVFNLLKEKGNFCLSICDTCTQSIAAEADNSFDENIAGNEIADYEFIPLRQYFYIADGEAGSLSARMKSYLEWIASTKYCCSCGKELKLYSKENALECEGCGKIHYPRIEPCIIVLVHKGEEVLLLRHSYRNQDKFTCLAGFIEVGETAEQCVQREVAEEVGIKIKNIKYKGSQGWPFPDQLMLAFYAEYDSGELKLQENEISEAKWFKKEEMQNIPGPGTVAWKLIHDDF